MSRRLILILLLCAGCPAPSALSVSNAQAEAIQVYVSFGSDSSITAKDWSFCEGEGLTCNFALGKNSTKPLPNPSSKYINATFAFGEPVGCGVTKAEVNLNNPSWYDIADVSLVDGYSNKVEIVLTPEAPGDAKTLGPPAGASGNEKVFGLYPYGCDICVERQNPPCGISKGTSGCKTGGQYDPDVPCQWQGSVKGGGGHTVDVKYMGT